MLHLSCIFQVLVLFQVLFQKIYTNSCYVLHISQICKRNCWHYALSSAHQPHRTGDPSSQQGGCKVVPVVTTYRARRHGQQRLRQRYLGVTLNGVNRLSETFELDALRHAFPYINKRRKQTRRESSRVSRSIKRVNRTRYVRVKTSTRSPTELHPIFEYAEARPSPATSQLQSVT